MQAGQAGVTNASFVWCPNTEFPNSPYPTFESLYPGDEYVDWTCLDGYNWGATQATGWQSFAQVYDYSYNEILRVAPSKPLMIGKFGAAEGGAPAGESKANWFADALTRQISGQYKRMRAIVYFNWVWAGADLRIESSPAAQNAWREGIGPCCGRPSYYYGNEFKSITGKLRIP